MTRTRTEGAVGALVASADAAREAFVAARLATLGRVPAFRGGAEAADHLRRLYQRGRDTGAWVHERGAGWQLAYFRDPQVWYGGPAVIGFADCEPGHGSARAELAAALRAHAAALDDTTLLEIAADDPALREVVSEATGLGVDSVLQVGAARAALQAVGTATWQAPSDGPRVTLREATLGDVEALVELERAAFAAEPEYCWFGAYPLHLANVRAGLARVLQSGEGVHVVVESGGVVLGHAGADISAHPYWGRSAGFGLTLAPALRGRGLLKVLYRETLARLVHVQRVETLRGGTSQPGVLAWGLRMQRPWGALYMRRGVAFPFAHFARFMPPAQS